MILFIDNYDSFSYNLVSILKSFDQDVHVIRNDEILTDHLLLEIKAVVLSPGPGLPSGSNKLMEYISTFQGLGIPILGICLGMQALAQFNGGTLVRLLKPMHGKVSEISTSSGGLYEGVEAVISVVRYHSWFVSSLSKDFVVTSRTSDNIIMTFENDTLNIDGIQYHPESILTIDGEKILLNWLRKRNIIYSV